MYKAWSEIVYTLIPNVQDIEKHLKHFADIIEADEVLLFERATFLVISHCQMKPHRDHHRFEKVSNIIKQFKLSCIKMAAQFVSMEVKNSRFAAFIDIFTPNTYVMVIMSDLNIRKFYLLAFFKVYFLVCLSFFILLFIPASAATLINIKNARKHFEKLEGVKSGSSSSAITQR